MSESSESSSRGFLGAAWGRVDVKKREDGGFGRIFWAARRANVELEVG